MTKKTYLWLLVMTAVLIALGLMSLIFRSAFAYQTDGDLADNYLDIGDVSTSVVEEFPDPEPLYPGEIITKKVSVINDGSCDCYVRVQVLFSRSDMENMCIVDFNLDDWRKSGDWWYYTRPLKPDEKTTELFTKVIINSEADETKIVPFDVIIRQESWQASGYEDCFAPWVTK